MSVDAVGGALSQEMVGAEGSPSVWNSAMCTDLLKRMKNATQNPLELSQSAIASQAALIDELNCSRSITHIALGDAMHSSGMVPMASLFGINLFVGSVMVRQAYNRLRRADIIGSDKEGLHAGMELARGSVHTSAAAAVISSRVVSATSVFLRKKHPDLLHSTLSVAAKSLNIVANCFVGLLQIAIGCLNALALRNVHNLSGKFAKAQNAFPEGGVERAQKITDFITKRLMTSPQTILRKLMSKCNGSEEKVKEYLANSALKAAHICVARASAEYQLNLSKSNSKELVHTLIAELDKSDLTFFLKESLRLMKVEDSSIKVLIDQLSPSQLWGLAVEAQSKTIKKELKFSSSTSSSSLQMARMSIHDGLKVRLSSEDPFIVKAAVKEAEGLASKILDDLSFNQKMHVSRIIACIINLIASVISSVFTSGAGAIAAAASFMTSSVVSSGLDLAIFHKAAGDMTPMGKHDKWIASAAIALTVVSLIASIILISVFSFGTVPLVLAVIGGSISLITAAVAYKKFSDKRALLEREAPTLSSMKKSLVSLKQDAVISSSMRALIQKLAKPERRALKILIAQQSGCAAEGVRSLSQEDALLDKEHDFAGKLFLQDPFSATISKTAKKLWNSSRSEAIRGLYERLLSQGKVSVDEIQEYFQSKLSTEEKSELLHSIYLSRAKKDFSWHFLKRDVTVGQLLSAISSLENASLSKKI